MVTVTSESCTQVLWETRVGHPAQVAKVGGKGGQKAQYRRSIG